MFKYLRLILTLALLSVVAHPSVAQNFDATGRSIEFSLLAPGDSSEKYELSLLLTPQDKNLDKSAPQRRPCNLFFSFIARDATGDSQEEITSVFNLTPQAPFKQFTVPYDTFRNDGPTPVHIQGTMAGHDLANCRVRAPSRLEAADGTTAGQILTVLSEQIVVSVTPGGR